MHLENLMFDLLAKLSEAQKFCSYQKTICTIIAWVRDGASGDGRSVTCI